MYQAPRYVESDDKSIIRYIIGSTRIKYSILHGILDPKGVQKKKYRACMMLIDGHAIFDKLLRSDNLYLYEKSLDETVIDIVVNFFNVLGHYRNYMAQYFQLDNDIFVSFNMEDPIFQYSLYPEFERKMIRRYTNPKPEAEFIVKAIIKAWGFICSISPYFEGIYCIDAQGVEDFTTLVTASNFYRVQNVLKIIFTKNSYANQLVGDDVIILHDKRDDSYTITKKNPYTGVLDNKSKVLRDANENLPAKILPMIWALGGCADVNVGPSPLTKTPNSPCKVALEMVRSQNKYNRADWLFEEYLRGYAYYQRIVDTVVFGKLPTLKRRYKVLTIQDSCAAVTPDQLARITAHIVDLFDENQLESFNDILGRNKADPELFDIQALNKSEGVKFDYE